MKGALESLSETMSIGRHASVPKTSPKIAPVYVRPRTRSSVTIRHLPPEILTRIFKGMHISDLLSLRRVCKSFHELVDTDCLWMHASFSKVWPSTERIFHFFSRAASHGNFEALIKLAFSRLYNERLPYKEQQLSLEEQARQAAVYFCAAEQLSESTFAWVFLRPPWSTQVPSCKFYVCQAMMEYAEQERLQVVQKSNGSIALGLGYTMSLIDKPEEAAAYIEQAAQLGLHEAQVFRWANSFSGELSVGFTDSGRELDAVRQLRSIARQKPDGWGHLILSKCYMRGMLGGLDWSQAVPCIRRLFQSSCPINVESVLSCPHEVNSDTRYILMDWLAEVATNLNLTTVMLLNAVAIVDRCLLARSFRRGEIQLLGVSALLITSRYMAKDMLTIREAAWYTDNTYTYDNVVEMAGDIISILKGRIRQVTSCILIEVLKPAIDLGPYGMCLLDYIAELCMLQAYMTVYSPAKMAASSILVARILLNFNETWPSNLEDVTGFSVEDLTPCVFSINKCLQDDVHYDSQNTPMQAVKQRYSGEDSLYDMTEIKHLSDEELRDKLGVVSPKERMSRSRRKLRQAQELICSPSRGKQNTKRMSTLERPGHDDASTPPLDLDSSGYDGDNDDDGDPFDLNESFCSIQSEYTESEPRTDSSYEMSSEPDNVQADMSTSNPPSFISGCSELALSSPFRIKINISNFSFSTSSSSGIGSSSSSAASCSQSGSCSGSGFSEHLPHQDGSISEDDSNSLGFPFAEEISSQDEDVDDVKSQNHHENNSSAILLFPVMESSASGNGEGDKGRFYDPVDFECVEEYGVLNEAFCEQDTDLAAPLPGSIDSFQQTFDVSAQTCGEPVSGHVMAEHWEAEGEGDDSLPKAKNWTRSTSQLTRGGGQSSAREKNIPTNDQPVDEQSCSVSSEQLSAGNETKGRSSPTAAFVPLVGKHTSDTDLSGVVRSQAGDPTSWEESLSCPVAVSGLSPDQGHNFVLGGNSASLRRKSLRSSSKVSLQLDNNSSADFCQSKMGICEDMTHCMLRKRNRTCSESMVVAEDSQKNGQGQYSPAAATRKSPRIPVMVSSPHDHQAKRQRRNSACYHIHSFGV